MERHPFRLAVERRDLDAVFSLLHDDVEFLSPAVYRPYRGRPAVSHVLRHAGSVLEDLTYVDELHGEHSVGLVFTAHVGDRDVEGLDHLDLDEEGRVVSLRVMIRPLSGLIALTQQMSARFEADPVPTDVGD